MRTRQDHTSMDAVAGRRRWTSGAVRHHRPSGTDARLPASLGFSLMELLVVVAIIAILAAILVMPALGAKMRSNETGALAALRTIATQQENFRSQAIVDQDSNGLGEYGLLSELAAIVVPRRTGATVPVSPRLIDPTFETDANGFAIRYGFHFQIYLPTDALGGVGNDADLSGNATTPGPVLDSPEGVMWQEYYWCAYAWPAGRNTGERAFFVDHAGVIYQTYGETVKYSGLATTPAPDAAYGGAAFASQPGGNNNKGNDGNVWTVVQ